MNNVYRHSTTTKKVNMKHKAPTPDSSRIVVRSTFTARLCADFRKECIANDSTTNTTGSGRRNVQELIVKRKRMDALLAGTIQDIMNSQNEWKMVELNGSSQWALRLMETLFKLQRVDKLVLLEPSEAVLLCLSGLLENRSMARVDHVVLRAASITRAIATELARGIEGVSICNNNTNNTNDNDSDRRISQIEFCDCVFASLGSVKQIANGVSKNPNITKLSFCGCHLEDHEVTLLMKSLEHHPSLMHLDLSVNFCQADGMETLATVLLGSSITPLHTLLLPCQDVWDNRDYYIHLASAISNPHCTLHHLNLSSNFLNDDHFIWLVLALRDNHLLQVLNLHDNLITDVGMMTFAKTLHQLDALQEIVLTKNRYTHQGIKAVLDVLVHNTRLTELCVDHIRNNYGDNHPNDNGTDTTTTTTRNENEIIWNYYLALNRGGRYCKSHPNVPLGLWPHILAKANEAIIKDKDPLLQNWMASSRSITTADIIFDLLQGPALLER